MGDLLKTGLEWLASKRTASMAVTVTYRRSSTTVDLKATVGKPDKETVDENNIRTGADMIDFLILSSDFSTAFGNPTRGDDIICDGRTYKVLDFAGQGCWRWSGRPGLTMRIHTKQVG